MKRAILTAIFTTVLVVGCASSGGAGGGSSGSESSGGVSGGVSMPSVPSTGGGAPAPAPPSVPTTAQSSSGSAGSAEPEGPDAAQTPEERVAVLDKRLDKSLGDFDETLRKEQERVANERDARSAEADVLREGDASGGSAGGDGADGAADSARPGDLRSEGERQASKAGDAKDGGSESAGGSGSSGGAGKRVVDGSDDDIVAKRLRRAAEQETDPELKEKLWQKYLEYKRGAQKSGD